MDLPICSWYLKRKLSTYIHTYISYIMHTYVYIFICVYCICICHWVLGCVYKKQNPVTGIFLVNANPCFVFIFFTKEIHSIFSPRKLGTMWPSQHKGDLWMPSCAFWGFYLAILFLSDKTEREKSTKFEKLPSSLNTNQLHRPIVKDTLF